MTEKLRQTVIDAEQRCVELLQEIELLRNIVKGLYSQVEGLPVKHPQQMEAREQAQALLSPERNSSDGE